MFLWLLLAALSCPPRTRRQQITYSNHHRPDKIRRRNKNRWTSCKFDNKMSLRRLHSRSINHIDNGTHAEPQQKVYKQEQPSMDAEPSAERSSYLWRYVWDWVERRGVIHIVICWHGKDRLWMWLRHAVSFSLTYSLEVQKVLLNEPRRERKSNTWASEREQMFYVL